MNSLPASIVSADPGVVVVDRERLRALALAIQVEQQLIDKTFYSGLISDTMIS